MEVTRLLRWQPPVTATPRRPRPTERLPGIFDALADLAVTVGWAVKVVGWIVVSGFIVSGWAVMGLPEPVCTPKRPKPARWHRQAAVLLTEIETALSGRSGSGQPMRDQGSADEQIRR
jgi:hypothetical protein